jgi:hypothetical protein
MIAVGLALVPVWYGYRYVQEDEILASIGRDDEHVYLTWIRQAKEGEWLFNNPHTLEPHRRLYFNPFFLVVGKTAALLNCSPLTALNIFRVIGGVSLVIGIFLFFKGLLGNGGWSWVALVITCFAGGLGYLSFSRSPLIIRDGGDFFWASRSITEARSLPSILFYPQGPISVLLLLIFWFSFSKLRERIHRAWLITAWVAGAFLVAIHPYDLVLAVLVPVGVLFLTLPASQQDLLALGASFMGFIPVGLYFLAVSNIDPVFSAWSQTKSDSPSNPFQWLILWAPLLPLALIGLRSFLKKDLPNWVKKESLILVTWFVLLPFLVYLPVNFQRRLAEGAYLPVSFLATLGVLYLWRHFSKWGLVLAIFLIGLSLPDYPFQVRQRIRILREDIWGGYYLPKRKIDAFFWLDHYSGDTEAVLALPDDGLYVPAFSGNRVYLGHWANTVNALQKWDLLVSAFQATTPPFLRRQFLLKNQIAFLFAGKELPQPVRSLAVPWEETGLSPVFENEAAVIFKVVRET